VSLQRRGLAANSQPDRRTSLPIRNRLSVLTTLSIAGAVTFLPFLRAGNGQPIGSLVVFALVVVILSTLAAWGGLRAADAVDLPMPYLRALDSSAERIPSQAWPVTFTIGIVLGAAGLALLRLTSAPALPGSFLARALSVFFAAGPLEIVLHLFLMSVVVRIARGRRWFGIIIAALALVAFHLSDAAGLSTAVVLAGVVANGAIGVALGWIYATYGFEFTMAGHAVAHLITVLAG
jgi:hypothetical protein